MHTESDFSSIYEVVPEALPGVATHNRERVTASRPCILLAESSPATLTLLSKPLAAYYELLVAKDGADAWEVLQTHSEIELVITDIKMPRLTGHELLVKIRESDKVQIRGLPVIVIARVDDKGARDQAFRNGANDFISDLTDPMELQARVHVHHTLARTIHQLEISRRALAEQATTDPLTQLKNRRAFLREGTHGLALSKRSNTRLSLMLLDIDHFKRVNDTFGHQAGDKVLIAIAQLLGRMSRSVDTVARIGGEEFAVVLPDTDQDGVATLAERIRAAVEKESIDPSGEPESLTISIGVATSGFDPAASIEALLKTADRRLYTAKKRGRNQVCASDKSQSSSTR